MSTSHYLLFSEASCSTGDQSWRFVLQNIESGQRMVVSDGEPATCGERLELLAVVRGLEALDGPARVTLVTRSRYVSRGIRLGIMEWRANDWQWERFGRVVPVKDRDLWQRVDRALLFHKVECQAWQFEDAATGRVATQHTDYADAPSCHVSPMTATQRCPDTATESTGRLAPTKRRLVARRSYRRGGGKRQATPTRSSSRLHNLSAAMVGKAAELRESLRSLGQPARQWIAGAA